MSATPLNETFAVEPHGRAGTALVRYVTPARGTPYRHACPLEAFEATAWAIEEAGERGFTTDELWAAMPDPRTQISTAVAFLKERGIVETRRKRNYPATGGVRLDAMTEYYALLEEPQEERAGG